MLQAIAGLFAMDIYRTLDYYGDWFKFGLLITFFSIPLS